MQNIVFFFSLQKTDSTNIFAHQVVTSIHALTACTCIVMKNIFYNALFK